MPYPGPILRRTALLDALCKWEETLSPIKNCLEIGYGSGIFLYEFYRLGYICNGYDISPSAENIAENIFNADKKRFNLKNALEKSDNNFYDVVAAFEVLEHIENDADALKTWKDLLKVDGLLFLSVPEKMKYFGSRDEWAGHIRRYSKNGLMNLFSECGFEIKEIINYGFPLQHLMRLATISLVDKPYLKRKKKLTEQEGTQYP